MVSAILFGSDKISALDFSFFLTMPTMASTFAYDLLQGLQADDHRPPDSGFTFAFVTAFIAALDHHYEHSSIMLRASFSLFSSSHMIVGSTFGLIGLTLGL